MKGQKGFTLIELLVVIAVIGLLASIVLVTVNSTRIKARNTKRLSNLRQYTVAFEMAYDKDGEYPDTGDGDWRCLGDYSDDLCWSNNNESESAALNAILDDYIPSLPADETLICGYANNPNNCYEGWLYRCNSRPNGVCESIDVRWFLEDSNQSCGMGRVIASYTDCTYCRYP